MRKTRERIDAEVARELLNQAHPRAEDLEGDQDARLFWLIQRRLIRDDNPERGQRLATLHTEVATAPGNTAAHQERDRLMTELATEALAEFEEEERAIEAGTRKDHWNA